MKPIEPHGKTASMQARRAIDGALCRDRGRLLGLWSKCKAAPDDASLGDAFALKLQASIAERERRAAALPAAEVDASLPIATAADDIVELIRKHQVVVIAGETGSGKTTQLPKLCLQAGRGVGGHDRLHAAAANRRAFGGAARRRGVAGATGRAGRLPGAFQ